MSEKLKPLNLPIILLAVVGLVGGVVLISIAIALVGTYYSSAPNYELEGQEARDFVEERFLALPEDASDFYLYYFSVANYEVYIRFSASPEAIESWLDNSDLCFDALSSTGQLYNTSGEVLSWWTPKSIPPNANTEPCESNPSYQIAFDLSDSDLWIVYLAIFSA